MKTKLRISCLLMLVSTLLSGQSAPLEKLSFLEGIWSGTGSGFGNERSRIESSFELVLNDNYIRIRNESRFEPTENNHEGEVHIDEGFISYDKVRKLIVFRQFNIEGYINTYVLVDSLSNENSLVFLTEDIENFVDGGSARWTINKINEDQIETIFDVSFPEQGYTCFGTNRLVKVGFSSCADDAGWTALLDNELSRWDSYLSYSHKVGYNGQQPVDGEGNLLEPIGLNQDGYGVFTVTEEENEPLLKVSGEIYGCLISKEEYENYHLRLKVKWGTRKWDPRKNLLMDSGILYHSIGEPGIDYWRSWMLSQEFQIMEGHMGDFWSIANSAIDIKAYIPEGIINPVADISQDFISVGSGEDISGFCLRSASYENPHGEWNTLELICHEGKSIHMVNGNVVMVLMNSRFIDNGQSTAMDRGKIQIQSEAAEVYFKDIEIRPLETLPAEYLQYFQ